MDSYLETVCVSTSVCVSVHECMCYTYEHPWYACGLEPQQQLFLIVFVCSVHDGCEKKIHKVMVLITHAYHY